MQKPKKKFLLKTLLEKGRAHYTASKLAIQEKNAWLVK
jgi:hypothetical protein